jgi:hypothetical protein
MSQTDRLGYLEWQALIILYKNRERVSSPVRYVGLKTTVMSLIKHEPPLVQWVGKPSENMVHITNAGVLLYETGA